jgi:hypothetical protein
MLKAPKSDPPFRRNATARTSAQETPLSLGAGTKR